MQKYDAAIVGAGPIGGYIAGKLAEKNFKIAIFEKNKQIGKPMKCAGLVSSRVFEDFDISKKGVIQNEIKGAHIHSPSGTTLSIGGDKTYALVINRTLFDQKLIEKAEKNGANIFLESKINKIVRRDGEIEIKTPNSTHLSRLLIGTDGPFSNVRKSFQMPQPKEFIYSAGAELSNTNLEPDFVHIFVGNNISPGFFAWIIPTNKEGSCARAGLCVDKNAQHSAKYYLNNLFKNKNSLHLIKSSKIEKRLGGAIPLGFIKKIVTDNVMLAGDAAAQVKPTSGGGIFPGLSCAEFCSDVAIDAIKCNNFSADYLKKYQKLCLNSVGKELSKGYRLRAIFRSLSDAQMDKYLSRFSDPAIIEIINNFGDIDYPSKLVKPLIKKAPLLLKLVLNP